MRGERWRDGEGEEREGSRRGGREGMIYLTPISSVLTHITQDMVTWYNTSPRLITCYIHTIITHIALICLFRF